MAAKFLQSAHGEAVPAGEKLVSLQRDTSLVSCGSSILVKSCAFRARAWRNFMGRVVIACRQRRFNLTGGPFCVTELVPRIGMAGLVSPADSWNRNYYPLLSGPTAGRSDEVRHAAGGS